MGRYIRKCKGNGEVAVMEVTQVGGVRTRARALAMSAAESSSPAKRSKVIGSREELVQLKGRRQVTENSVSAEHASPNSSNGSTELSNEKLNFADLEQKECVEIETSTYKFTCRERRETNPLSELESKERPLEANSGSQQTAEKMPSESQLEEFFTAAEKKLQKQFTDKYNYDVVKDVPLDGRYEWTN